MTDERMGDDLMNEIMSNLKQLPVFGSTDTEDRDAAIDLITHLRERAEKLEAENARLRTLLQEAYPFIGWGPAPDGLADREYAEELAGRV